MSNLRAGQSVIILGAGVVGITTAYALAKAGLNVTVIDRNEAPAAETSYANGAQLSYSHGESVASPASLRQLLVWMLQPNSPVMMKDAPRTHEFAMWALRFLWASRASASRKHTQNLLQLGLYSRTKMSELLTEVCLQFEHAPSQILCVYHNRQDLGYAQKQAQLFNHYGADQRLFSADACYAHEPALRDGTRPILGGVLSALDAVGDAQQYTVQLADYCHTQLGVQFVYGEQALRLTKRNDAVDGVRTEANDYHADAVVLAAGSYSSSFAGDAGVALPLQPMKGYSITFDANDCGLRSSVTDVTRRLVHTRLGNRIRIAGFAEFAGHDASVRQKPIEQLMHDAVGFVPSYRIDSYESWACLRSQTPDGLPVIGATKVAGLWLNTGHGMLGWTQAAGSAALLADCMLGKSSEISLQGYLHDRF